MTAPRQLRPALFAGADMTSELLLRVPLWLALGGAAFGCTIQTGSRSQPPPSPTCVVSGTTYQAGTSWPAPDGCNTCSCDGQGRVACTQIGCAPRQPGQPPPPPPPAACPPGYVYNGQYCAPQTQSQTPPGSPPPSGVTCVYGGVSHRAGETWPAADGCNTCSCDQTGLAACTQMGCGPR